MSSLFLFCFNGGQQQRFPKLFFVPLGYNNIIMMNEEEENILSSGNVSGILNFKVEFVFLGNFIYFSNTSR